MNYHSIKLSRLLINFLFFNQFFFVLHYHSWNYIWTLGYETLIFRKHSVSVAYVYIFTMNIDALDTWARGVKLYRGLSIYRKRIWLFELDMHPLDRKVLAAPAKLISSVVPFKIICPRASVNHENVFWFCRSLEFLGIQCYFIVYRECVNPNVR